jgi:hypothetical protein
VEQDQSAGGRPGRQAGRTEGEVVTVMERRQTETGLKIVCPSRNPQGHHREHHEWTDRTRQTSRGRRVVMSIVPGVVYVVSNGTHSDRGGG